MSETNVMGVIRVHYWAAARSAAGVPGEDIAVTGPLSLTDLLAQVVGQHGGTRLPEVLRVCSVLIGDRPVTSEDPAQVVVRPGDTVEFLPPFAGG